MPHSETNKTQEPIQIGYIKFYGYISGKAPIRTLAVFFLKKKENIPHD